MSSAKCGNSGYFAAAGQGDLIAKNEVMSDKSMFTRYVETGMGQSIGNLCLRYLPPGSIAFLYASYCAEPGKHASYATFRKEYIATWKNTLRFRQPSDFSDCRVCASLKHRLENCASLHEKSEVARDLQDHHRNIAYSRDFEEVLRTTPPYGVAKPILAVFTDGMANTHWCIPRLRKHRGAKTLSALPRPRCKVQGVWAFYFGVHVFVADCTMPHDGDMTCEVVARVLEKCKEVATLRGHQMPEEIVVWTDGTTRENRNNTFLQFIAFLQASGMFKVASALQHDMGHTHNIVDQLYGIIKRAFQYVDQLEDLDAVVDVLRSIMARPGLRGRRGVASRPGLPASTSSGDHDYACRSRGRLLDWLVLSKRSVFFAALRPRHCAMAGRSHEGLCRKLGECEALEQVVGFWPVARAMGWGNAVPQQHYV